MTTSTKASTKTTTKATTKKTTTKATTKATTKTTTKATTKKTTTRTTSTTTTPYSIYSLATNVSTSNLINQGYKVIYNQTYATPTNLNDLTTAYNQCNNMSIICLGGAAVGSNTLLLVSCANCKTLLSSYTNQNQPTNCWLVLTCLF